MSTDLVYRLRTCAAAITASADSGNPWNVTLIANHAVDLLIEASNLLDVPEPLGEPMEVLKAAPTATTDRRATWGGDLPAVQAQPCPTCGDIGARTVKREEGPLPAGVKRGRKLIMKCPRCAATWEYGKHGA